MNILKYENMKTLKSWNTKILNQARPSWAVGGETEQQQSHTSPSSLDTLSDSLFPALLDSHWSLNQELLSDWSSRRQRCRRVAGGGGARWRHEAYSQLKFKLPPFTLLQPLIMRTMIVGPAGKHDAFYGILLSWEKSPELIFLMLAVTHEGVKNFGIYMWPWRALVDASSV